MAPLLVALLIGGSCLAADHGVMGRVYPIAETDIMQHVQEKLNRHGQSSQASAQELKRPNINVQPNTIGVVRHAKVCRSFTWDPSVFVDKAITDHEGKVIVQKGTRFNPLSQVSLESNLVFFDGNSSKQIAWAREQEGKWVLVSGNPFKLEEDEKRPTYFDQMGILVKKLGIQAFPARVFQEGQFLRIEEIPVEASS